MNDKSLKINIIASLSLLLLAGMLITAFVSTGFVRKEKLGAEIKKTDLMVFHIISYMSTLPSSVGQDQRIRHYLPQFFEKTHLDAIYFLNDRDVSEFNRPEKPAPDGREMIQALMRQSLRENSRKILFHGTTWGVFWKENRYCTIAYPLSTGRAVGFTLGLDGIFSELRSLHKVIFYSIILNTLFLCVIGYFRFSRMIITPVRKLTDRVRAFNWKNDSLYMLHNSDNEFGLLSRSINSMIGKIQQDKQRLETSIEELKHANTELKKAQTGMIRAEKMSSIGRLSAGIAHEIGNPIGIVLGYLDLLKHDRITDTEKGECLHRAESEIRRVDKIIRQLLDFSRKKKIAFQEYSLHPIILEIIDMVKIQPGFSDIELITDLAAGNDTVFLDRDQLRQVFLNLMLNAADAISSAETGRGMIGIRTGNTDSMIRISIEDNGIGIPEGDIGRIFDPFFTTKEPGTGTGLGLWVSYMMVEGLNGTIRAESSENRTVFHIELPLKPAGEPREGEHGHLV